MTSNCCDHIFSDIPNYHSKSGENSYFMSILRVPDEFLPQPCHLYLPEYNVYSLFPSFFNKPVHS